MKKHTLLYIYSLLILLASSIMPAHAQQPKGQYALYNYRNDGEFNAWLNVDIEKITYSCIDTLGIEHDDVVVQEVWTPDSVYRIPLEAIDSIGFRAPEPVYKEELFHIRKYHMPFILQADGLTLRVGKNIEKDSIPSVGQIVISDVIEEPLSRGFSGRVLSIESAPNSYVITCEPVALTDIFERLVLVGRSESFTPEEILQVEKVRKASPNNPDWDGTTLFEVGKFSVSIPSIEGFISNSKSDMTLGTISITPKFCVSFIADIRPFVHSHVKVLFENKSKVTNELHLKVSGESSLTETKKARLYLTKVPIPLVTGILYGEVAVSGDLWLKGNVDLKATFSKNLYSGDEFEWSTSDFWNINHERYDKDPQKSKKGDDENDENEWQSDVTLNVNGSFGFGASLDLVLFAVSENTLEISNTTTVGPELSGSLTFSSEGLKDGTLYSALKNTNVSFTPLKLSDEVKFNICMREFTLGSFSKDFGKKEFKLFPDFEPFSFSSTEEYRQEGYNPLGIYTNVTNDVIPIIPLKLGIGRYDKDDNLLEEIFAPNLYQYEEDWDNKWLTYDMSSLSLGESYIFHPLIRVWGLKALQLKALPQTVINMPPLSLSSSSLTLNIGDYKEIMVNGGWGDYEVSSSNPSVASANIVIHIPSDGNKEQIVSIWAKSPGSAKIKVIDKRNRMETSLIVQVVNEPIPQTTISVSHTEIDFGTVSQGGTMKKRFKVTNDGESSITIQASCESSDFELSDNNTKVTLAKGESKDYIVTCNGLSITDDVNAVIIITSDGSSESQCITLSARVEEEEAPYIPVKTETIVVKGVPYTMVAVEGGSFMMGSPDDDPDAGGIYSDEKPQHEVKLSNFAIGQTEVTQALWKVVMGDNPSCHKSYKNPVEQVSRDMCHTFITKLNALTGRTFRLPTEAEWEYAARGGKYSQGYKYAGSDNIDVVAWYDQNSNGVIHPVAQKKANELGLYDMSGNVWEFCQDYYDENYYSISPIVNPCNTTKTDVFTMRGGGPVNVGSYCRVAFRSSQVLLKDLKPVDSNWDMGIRLVLSDGKTGYNKTEAEDEAYAEFNNDVLSFYCDGERFSKTGETYEMPDYLESPSWDYEIRTKVKRVVFDSSFAKARPKCTMAWFSGMSSITEIEGLKYLNTSEVTYMSEMFYGCTNLKSLDVSHFNTSKVTYMGYMFDECSNLTYLDVSNFNTSKVTSMESMFRKCSSLTTLNVSNFNTSNVTDMSRMFAGCSNLMTLDVSNFNTSNVESMDAMFWSCSNLSILDVSHFITSNVRNMAWMFESCGKLKSLKVNNFDTSNVTDMEYMFYGCSELSEINVSNFNTSNVHNMAWMFAFCNSVTSIDISTFDISSLVDEYAENALQGMFYGCTNLKTIKCGELWNMKSTAYSSDMFKGCFNLVGGKQTKYDENRTDGEYARIDGGVNNPGYFTDINATILPSGAVDLGLPSGTLWGSCNVGASRPEEFGGYYAWGETEEKSEYTSDNYLYKDKNLGRNINGTEYDVAHVKLGGNWQMPTRKQIEELINKCSREVATINGVAGMKFIGTNGNSIFLPFNEEFFDSVFGVYWTSTSNTNTNSPFDLFVDEDGSVSCFESNSEMGRAVRPVEVSRMKPYSITITPAEEEVDFGAVKQDTEKTETFIVTNTGNADLTFHVDGSTEFTRFEVSDNMKSYTLAPGESKTYTVTAHGMEAGYKASTLLFVKSDNGEEETKVSLLAIGTDDEPLINKTSLTMTVGERASIRLKTPLYSAEADDYNIVDYMGGGPGETMRWDDGYESEVSHSSSGLTFTALKAGVVHVTFTEKYTNKKEVLTITVTQDPEVAGPGEDTISGEIRD